MTETRNPGIGGNDVASYNFDDPTVEETELQRGVLEGRLKEELDKTQEEDIRVLEYSEYMRFWKAKDHLISSDSLIDAREKAAWLKSLEYEGVCAMNCKIPVDFDYAVAAGYDESIDDMFESKRKDLKEILKKSRISLEKTGFFKRSKRKNTVKKSAQPSVRIKKYQDAARILSGYEEKDSYLRSIIRNYMPDEGDLINNSADFNYLKYCGRRIRGVAQKMLKSHPVAENIIKLKETSNRSERECLEERIRLQLKCCNYEGNSWVTNFYNWAKKVYPHK
jgi:hypothetical protein